MMEEAANQKPLCYYVMNNGVVKEHHAIFERPNTYIMYHLKLLFTKEKVDNIGVNKQFVDGGVTVNPIPHYLLKKRRIKSCYVIM